MNINETEVVEMTESESQMLVEAIKIIVEKAETKEEALQLINRVQEKGKKKPQ